MLVRIVHLYFTQEDAEKFREIFRTHEHNIRHVEGCRSLELLRDVADGGHFTTISHWEDLQFLEQYRKSDLFREVWGRVKPLFVRPPSAHSLKSCNATTTDG